MRKSFKAVLTLLALTFLSFTSFAQKTSVRGVIVDDKNKETLIGATVQVEGTSIGAATALNGSFSISVPSGKQTLILSFVGYIDKKMEINVAGEELNLGEIGLSSSSIDLEEVRIVSSFARDRITPVAVANIKPVVIEEKLGTQEFPEILKSTPSVYATKQGGGYGDSRINLRGFDSNNIGVLINGVPVNDMESGRVYWSNWAGLSDVTQSIQVQRGLGASKLAISSVGGTLNILTKSTDAKKGGNIFYGIGHDGYQKEAFTISTGLLDNGWAVTASGAHTTGEGYVKATNWEGWSYFVNIAKRINDEHRLSFTAFGAPQWHNQRSNRHLIKDYLNHEDGIRFNSDYGIRNGEIYSTAYAYNYYHKPQISLNHYWDINKTTFLSTSAYASIARGGGRRAYGETGLLTTYDYSTGQRLTGAVTTPEGLIDWDEIARLNAENPTGARVVMANAINSHDWYGVLSNLTTSYGDFNLTAGFDGRYYKGYHTMEIDDLLGGAYTLNTSDINRDRTTPLKKGDYISYYNLGEVLWAGLFGQAEYVKDQYSAFLSVSISESYYRRVDYFQYTPENQVGDWLDFFGYSLKGGANYNIDKNHNVFVNGGYFRRAPYFRFAYQGHTNTPNPGVKDEQVYSTEIGYGYRSKYINGNLTAYRTLWLDKALTRSMGNNETANLTGLDANHKGIEAEITAEPVKGLRIKGMFSIADWRWNAEVDATIYNMEQDSIDHITLNIDGVHVGDAAQTTAAIGIDYTILPKLKIGADYNYFGRIWSQFNIEDRGNQDNYDSWRMPNYSLLDVNLRYTFKLGNLDATLFGKVNNLFDTEYIADATDGAKHDASTAIVYYGFGRTWSLSLKVKF